MSCNRATPLGLLLAPVPAVALGALVMAGAGLPVATWLANVVAMLLGLLIAGAAWTRRGAGTDARVPPGWVIAFGLALLGATLLSPGTAGVHRWVTLGPLRLHAGALLLPPLLDFLWGARWAVSVVAAFTTLLVLLLQPDAAQACSFCAGWIALASARRGRGAQGVMLVSLALAGASLIRSDPLGPVAHVEGILGMAAAQGLWLAGGCLFALALLPLALLWCLRRPLGWALALYTTGTLAAAWLGDHPVPILGYGVSPILGYYLLAAASAHPRPVPSLQGVQ